MKKQGITADPSAYLGFQCPRNKAAALILPIPFEETTTYKTGTRNGPGAILEASQQVELYDDELLSEPYLYGIHTLDEYYPVASDPEEAVTLIEEDAQRHVCRGRILTALGGEHSITVGLVRAHRKVYPDLSVLQIDAHADLRSTYQGTPYNHACVMFQVSQLCPSVQVGIRSMSAGEAIIAEKRKSRIFFARDIIGREDWMEDALTGLSDHVYLTIDLDGLDPSIMPSVGTPEPGGLGWYELLEFLRLVVRKRRVVGCDVVELCPQYSNPAPDFLAAKLIHKVLGYIFSAGV